MPPQPIRPLAWMLGVLSSRDAASAAIGDILEELSERRAAGRGPLSPRLWVNLRTVRAIAAAIAAGTPRLCRSAGLIFRDAIRALRATPAQSLFVVSVLAIGVTTATVTFSVVDAVIFKPLPLAQPEQLVTISTRDEHLTRRITPDVFWRLRDHLRSVDSIAVRSTGHGRSVTAGGVTTDQWPVTEVTADIFRMMRWSPAIGRFWTAEDEARANTDVAVLGHRFWREQFHGTSSVLGETISVGTRTYQVIGVLPLESDQPELDLTTTPLWVPMRLPRTGADRGFFGAILARMRPGVSTRQLADDIQHIAGTPDWRPVITPLLDTYVEPVRRWMLLALGAAALVVLIACVSAANLMLTRSARRTREMAIRASLGASRRQIAAVVLAEGLLLSAAATVCALLSSLWAVGMAKAAVTTLLQGIFRASTIALNGHVLIAAIAITVITGVLVSLVPAWQTARAPVSSLLKDAESATASGRRRWRGAFLTAEIAGVVVLGVVAWLFVGSLVRAARIDLGIDLDHLVAVKPNISFRGTVDEVQQRIERVPGVSGVAVATGASLPLIGRAFGGAWGTTTLQRADGPTESGADASVSAADYRVTPNYFDVAGLRFTGGGS